MVAASGGVAARKQPHPDLETRVVFALCQQAEGQTHNHRQGAHIRRLRHFW